MLRSSSSDVRVKRTRDVGLPVELDFSRARARDWQKFLKPAQLWTQASNEDLDSEIQNMLKDRTAYRPKI